MTIDAQRHGGVFSQAVAGSSCQILRVHFAAAAGLMLRMVSTPPCAYVAGSRFEGRLTVRSGSWGEDG